MTGSKSVLFLIERNEEERNKIMKVKHFKKGSITTYNDNETFFIATLYDVALRNIHRGLATPYDYGYKPEYTYFTVDGYAIAGIPTVRSQFIDFFNKIKEVDMSDNNKYWILEHEGFYWCIPTSEIEFIHVGDEWHYLKDECADAIEKIVGRITLDEDEEAEFEFEEDEYCYKLNTFTVFERNLGHYLLYNPKADETIFKVYKSIQKWVSTPIDPEVCADNKVCLVTYLEEDWNAWFESIINQEYKYMNLTQIVWNSWLER